ncbi:tetratricopeptide repeat protein [Robiginitomaculum antarcticum]|uniref:tetratricopeptide repeat protein n=1 Tax=Robiginitomaculum antarcticum TaxID=437507 RepID=UPI0012E9E979|nr:hypothetical protein [Robiginitomaculum antarcticum]
MRRKVLTLVLSGMMLSPFAAAQTNPVEDEIIATGTVQRDPAISAFIAGDYATAEVEFERNAFCALRAERNFVAGVEAARNSSITAQIEADAVAPVQPTISGAGGSVTPAATPPPTATPDIRSQNFKKNESTTQRSCEDRGFQLYMAGLSQIKLGKLEDAKATLYRATNIRRDISDAYFRLALLEYQDGNLDKAKAQLRKLKTMQARCKRCDYRNEIDEQVTYLANLFS